MKKHWIEYSPTWIPGPMSYWIHVEVEGDAWHEANGFDPPLPGPVPGKGFACFHVEIDGAPLYFASLDELRACIAVLSQRVLSSNKVLSEQRGGDYGPSNHWLNRVPLRSMSWSYRQRVTSYLTSCLVDFQSQTGSGDGKKAGRGLLE